MYYHARGPSLLLVAQGSLPPSLPLISSELPRPQDTQLSITWLTSQSMDFYPSNIELAWKSMWAFSSTFTHYECWDEVEAPQLLLCENAFSAFCWLPSDDLNSSSIALHDMILFAYWLRLLYTHLMVDIISFNIWASWCVTGLPSSQFLYCSFKL